MASEGRDLVVSSVKKLAKDLQQVVEDGHKSLKAATNINDFVLSHGPDKPHGLYAIYPVSLYAECFRTTGVVTRKEVEETWSRHFYDSEVRECVEELLSAEEAYRSLIKEIEREMQRYEDATAVPIVSVGDRLPEGLSLTEARSGEAVGLQNYCKKTKYTLFVLRKHFI